MNAILHPARRVAWLRAQFSLTVLVALLQRTPAARLVQLTTQVVAASPAGAVLKSALAAIGALGAVHSLAGATVLVASQPSPVTVTEGRAITPIAFTVSDTINLGSWRMGGNLPPGLKLIASQGGAELSAPGVLDATTGGDSGPSDDPYATPGAGGNTMTTPVLTGTPTQAGSYTITLQAYQLGGLTGFNTVAFNYVINVAASTQPPSNSAPAFASHPQTQSVATGATITLSASAAGTPAPTFQWQKNGAAIAGATGATLTLSNVQAGDAGTYTVVATNAAGTVASNTATLTVVPPAGGSTPAIARQPQGQTIATGSTVVFSAAATGGGLSYQWRKNGATIAGATRSSYVLNAATAGDAGAYSVAVTNSSGSAASAIATLNVVNETNFGHLVNLSIRTSITAAEPFFTVGTVVGGGDASRPKPLLVRAVGPSLAAFGLSGALSDSKLDVLAGSTVVASNDNWAGDSAVFSQVGAFGFSGTSPKDAAIYNPGFQARDYTVQVSGVGGATGDVLAELYDATPGNTFSASTPRLVNVSVRKQIDAGANLTAGFVLGGNTARTVLVRAIGPGLAAFGVGGTMDDPQLALFSGAAKIAENDNWGGDPQLTAVGSSVGAFAIGNPAGRDAMLLITLAPGSYTAEVGGVSGTGGGSALVEIYEVP